MFDTHPHPFLDELNVEQRAAATHSGETLLILAGAGTGKTTTLCARVAWLLAEGVPAERILLLTFTRRAAREMIERARTLAERVAPDAGRMVGGTFHSVAHRLIRVHAASLGLEAGFGVLDAGDAGDLLDLVRQEHGGAESPRRSPSESLPMRAGWSAAHFRAARLKPPRHSRSSGHRRGFLAAEQGLEQVNDALVAPNRRRNPGPIAEDRGGSTFVKMVVPTGIEPTG